VPSHRGVRGAHSERAGDGSERLRCTGMMIRVRTANNAVHTLQLTNVGPRTNNPWLEFQRRLNGGRGAR